MALEALGHPRTQFLHFLAKSTLLTQMEREGDILHQGEKT
jgi:hypothetical protein